jgi:hypothetical protein
MDFQDKHAQKHIPTDAAELAAHLLANDGQPPAGTITSPHSKVIPTGTENEFRDGSQREQTAPKTPFNAPKIAPAALQKGIAPPATGLL